VAFCFVLSLSSCDVLTNNNEALPYYISKDLTPSWSAKNIHHIAAFSLMDQTNKAFNSNSLAGKIYVANFFFTTCPSICPKMTKCFKVLQDSISNMQNVEMVSFSVMPWVDSVKKLKAYGEQHKINPAKWHLLTGEKASIYSLGRASFFADNNKSTDSSTFLHTDKMYLIDQHKQIRGIYNATNLDDIARVLANIKILQKNN
jgi:protein SCO1/2